MSAPVVACTWPVARLERGDQREMFALLEQTYDCVSEARFVADLQNKDSVILLRESGSGRICGFSTLKKITAPTTGEVVFYSGDTVVSREYWGTRILGTEFLRNLFWEKLRRPWRKVYWVLISKGYKTYLLMANNFRVHYPRYECPTPPAVQRQMDALGGRLFAAHYHAAEGVVRFPSSLGQLKPGVADVREVDTPDPRVAFFQSRNPGWAGGDELFCLAEMSLTLPLRYAAKRVFRRFGGPPWRVPGTRLPGRAA